MTKIFATETVMNAASLLASRGYIFPVELAFLFGKTIIHFDDKQIVVFDTCDYCRTNKHPRKGLLGQWVCSCCGAPVSLAR